MRELMDWQYRSACQMMKPGTDLRQLTGSRCSAFDLDLQRAPRALVQVVRG